jgi:hypothetical protein
VNAEDVETGISVFELEDPEGELEVLLVDEPEGWNTA